MPLTEAETKEIRRILGREPTTEELAIFESQWSEHCSYKSSRRLLRLLPTSGRRVLIGPGRDAPAVEVFPGVAVVFKVESHNHPSAVDPYNGAATGIGGVVRDILTLGARPLALLSMLCLGDPRDSRARQLIKGIVRGASDYGSGIGVPVVAGDAWFDSSFNAQPLVNVACVGLVRADEIVSGRPSPGDLIVIIGSPTGREGVLGSSFASKPLEEGESDKGAEVVPPANPLMGRALIETVLEISRAKLAKYVKDIGAGGLATAVVETASDFGLGAELRLENLHTKGELSPLEMLVSETQERIMLVTDERKLEEIKTVLERRGVPASVVGFFDGSGRLRAYYRGRLVVDVPARETARAKEVWRSSRPPRELVKAIKPLDRLPEIPVRDALRIVLSSPNVASKRWIYEQFDSEVGLRTVVKPGRGDAAVLRLDAGDSRGIAVKGDANPRYTSIDPFRGAANTVAECYRNLVAVGSSPAAFVDEPNAGNPEDPEQFWYFEMMVKGIAWMADELGVPVVGGKVSLYNVDQRGRQVKPTATVVGVGIVEDVGRVATANFKSEGSAVLVVGTTLPELGGTEYLARAFGLECGEIPIPRPGEELRSASYVGRVIREGLALSVHDVSLGGLAAAVAEMAMLGGLGVEVDVEAVPCRGCSRIDEVLFSETQARYVVEVPRERVEEALRIARQLGAAVTVIGRTVGGRRLSIMSGGKIVVEESLENLLELYESALPRLLV